MLQPDYPIRTDRLLLRPIVATDVDAIFAYQSIPEVCRYIPYEPRQDPNVIATRIADAQANRSTLQEAGQVLWLGVALPDTDRVIGDVVLFWHSAEHRSGEIGYVFNPEHYGQGYATEICRALLALAFDGLGLHRVIARVDTRNDASAAVLRRAGLRQEARLRENEWFKGGWSDEFDFAILDREWRAQVGGPEMTSGES